MSSKSEELARRRATLLARAAAQRAQLGEAFGRMRGSAALLNAVWGLARTVSDHPAMTSSLAAFLLSKRLRVLAKFGLYGGLFGWALKSFQSWRATKRIP